MFLSMMVGFALAQDPTEDEPPDEPPAEPTPPAEPEPAPAPPEAPVVAPKKRNFLMEVNFRGRYMFLPDSIMDIWYFKNDDEALVPDRPAISAYALGIEYVVKDKQANGIFYVEYVVPMIDEGYWDDKEEPADHDDGSWLKPEKFGLVTIGANYGYELHANNWFSFMFGAGIGVGIKTGQLTEWQAGEPADLETRNNTDPDCGMTEAAYERRTHCADDGIVEVPPAIPFIDVNVGPKFNISDRASIRIEGGLHNLPYGGAAVGIVF